MRQQSKIITKYSFYEDAGRTIHFPPESWLLKEDILWKHSPVY